ncbi:MAG: hypothetical protein LIO85_06355 [Rikenellaceae bacterium]|nr:hypothetical protein [Rikenellaceae bacterium]
MSYKNPYRWIDDMPEERQMKLLFTIRRYINDLFEQTSTTKFTRLSDIWDYCSKKKGFLFTSSSAFGHFMKLMHKKRLLRQVITCCDVDDSNPEHWNWYFRRPHNPVRTKDSADSENIATRKIPYSPGYECAAKDGTKVKSLQELHIYEQLLKEPRIEVEYEKKFYWNDEFKVPDFTLYIDGSKEPYIWEHFGLTGRRGYFDHMAEKIEWYTRAGMAAFQKGGRLIVTTDGDKESFNLQVKGIIIKLLS